MKKIIAPILLRKTHSVKSPITIDTGVLIRDFPIAERKEFFGLRELKVKGSDVHYKLVGERNLFREFWGVEGMDYIHLIKSENCIEISGDDNMPTSVLQNRIHVMGCALKVLKSGSTGVLLYKFLGNPKDDFPAGGGVNCRTSPYYGQDYILKKVDIPELKDIYSIILSKTKEKEGKATMLIEKFILSVSNDLRKYICATEYFSILESLYLPEIESGELILRLSQRMALMLCNNRGKKKIYETYQEIKSLYKKRCILVHQSKDKFTKDELNKLEDLTRKSLKFFLKTPEFFERDYLEKLALGNK